MFLEGSRRSRHDQAPPAHLGPQGLECGGAPRRGRLLLEDVGLGAERGHEGDWRGQPGRLVAGAKAGLPLVAVETAGGVARHAVEQFGPHVVGQHAEDGRIGEGSVQEVHGPQVGPPFGQHPAQQREVVVLRQHGPAPVGPGDHGVGHGPVVGPVAVPGPAPVAVEAGPQREVPHVVVAVPEGRVGHDVVGHPVGVVVDGHRDQVEPVLVHAPLGHRLAIGRTHRHGGPRRAAAGQDPVQGRRQPTAGRDRDQLAVGPGAEGERPAVGDDDGGAHRRAHEGRGNVVGGTRSSAARSTSTAWGRSSSSGRLRWMRSPRSTWARRSAPSDWATSMRRPSSTP